MATGTGSPTMYLGVTVEDERPDTTVPVSIGFTSLGTGAGTLQVAQSSQALNMPADQTAINNLSWQTAVNEYGQTPEDTGLSGSVSYATAISNVTASGATYNSRRAYAESINELFFAYNFTQTRGTTMYYYARRSGAPTTTNGAPSPLTERVPVRRTISIVASSMNDGADGIAGNTDDRMTANVSNTSIIGGLTDNATTTTYYCASESPAEPNFRDSGGSGSGTSSPPTLSSPYIGWQTSGTFSTLLPGRNYFFWVMGRTNNNPGLDGTVISEAFRLDIIQQAGGAGQDAYGYRVKDSSGAERVSGLTRFPRFVDIIEAVIPASPGYYETPNSYTGISLTDDTWTILLERSCDNWITNLNMTLSIVNNKVRVTPSVTAPTISSSSRPFPPNANNTKQFKLYILKQ